MSNKKKLSIIFDMNFKLLHFNIACMSGIIFYWIFAFNSDNEDILIIILPFVILLLYSLLIIIYYLKAIKLIPSANVCDIYNEFINPKLKLEHACVLTENYLIKQYMIPTIIEVNKIVLIDYKTKYRQRIIHYLMIYTNDQKKYKVQLENVFDLRLVQGFQYDDKLEKELLKTNPDILIGFNKKNLLEIKNKYGIDLKKAKRQ